MALLGHIAQTYNISVVPRVDTSHLALHASELHPVDLSNETQKAQVVEFYRKMSADVRNPAHRGHLKQLAVILGLLKSWEYVYRGGKYYAVAKHIWPYASMQYRPTPYGLYAARISGSRAAKWINDISPTT